MRSGAGSDKLLCAALLAACLDSSRRGWALLCRDFLEDTMGGVLGRYGLPRKVLEGSAFTTEREDST